MKKVHILRAVCILFSFLLCLLTRCHVSFQDEDRKTRRNRKTTVSSQDRPTSITDMEPKDAYQAPLSDSDSD